MTNTLLTISPRVAALAVGLPAQRAIAQRFSGVLGMFSNLEVKSSTQPDGGEGLVTTQGLSPRGEV